jgi:hypothetical protein
MPATIIHCTVIPRALIEQKHTFDYDKEKYREMLLESAETVLSYFGFDRAKFGGAPKKNKKWWHWINDEKLKDRDIETI